MRVPLSQEMDADLMGLGESQALAGHLSYPLSSRVKAIPPMGAVSTIWLNQTVVFLYSPSSVVSG